MLSAANLLKEVLAHPDDDAPRLAYADWCEAQPESETALRGAMIRAQLAAHQSGEPYGGPAAEARRLIAQHQVNWTRELTPFVQEAPFSKAVDFYRGFVERVTVTAKTWFESHRAIRQLAPIRHLDILLVPGDFGNLVQSGAMEGIRSLSLRAQNATDLDVMALAKSFHLTSLGWLSLAGNHITEAGAEAMAQSKLLPALQWANFSGNPFDPGEQHSHDQGIIVESWLTPAGEALERRFGPIRWLHHRAKNLWDTEPDRFVIQPE